MTAPSHHGVSHIASYLRNLAIRPAFETHADELRRHAAYLDRIDKELRHLRRFSAGIRDHPTPEDIEWFSKIDEHWQRTQDEIDAEIASGA